MVSFPGHSIEWRKESSETDPEGHEHLLKTLDGDSALATLQSTDIGSMNPCPFSQSLLRDDPCLNPEVAQPMTDVFAKCDIALSSHGIGMLRRPCHGMLQQGSSSGI